MNKSLQFVLPNAVVLVLLALMVTTLFAPIWSSTIMPELFDFTNHLRAISEARAGILAGQFPVRTMQFQYFPWQYPYFQFYGSLLYTIAGILSVGLSKASIYFIYKLLIGLTQWIGSFYLYRLLMRYVGESLSALLGCAVYIYSPFNICDVAYLGGFAESISIGLVPVMLFYGMSLFKEPKRLDLLLKAGMVWSLIISSHIITFIYTSVFMGTFFLLYYIFSRARPLQMLALAAAYVLGVLLSFWYLMPIVLYQTSLVVHNGVAMTFWLMFGQITAKILFAFWPHINEIIGQFGPQNQYLVSDLVRPGIGWTLLFGTALYFVIGEKGKVRYRPEAKALLGVLVLAVLVMLSPAFFWQHVPQDFLVLEVIRRLLLPVMWSGAFLCALGMHASLLTRFRFVTVSVAIVLLSVASYALLTEVNAPTTPLDQVTIDRSMVNRSTYYLDSKVFKGVQHIDSVQLSSALADTQSPDDNPYLSTGKWLRLNVPFDIPAGLVENAYDPALFVENRDDSIQYRPGIDAYVDGIPVAHFPWNNGSSVFRVPLSVGLGLPFFRIQFNSSNFLINGAECSVNQAVPVGNMYLSGFMREDNLRHLPTIERFCAIENSRTSCDLAPMPGVDLVELPFLYYPKMLSVRLNGKVIPYESVMYGDFVLVGFKPLADQPNLVEVRFIGLSWANWLSGLLWTAWVILMLRIGYREWAHRNR